MNKRLRKKKHQGEFNFKAVDARGSFDPPLLTEEDRDRVVDDFIEFAEERCLQVSGGFSNEGFEVRVQKAVPQARKYRGREVHSWANVEDEDRDALIVWLHRRNYIKDWGVSKLFGAWTAER